LLRKNWAKSLNLNLKKKVSKKKKKSLLPDANTRRKAATQVFISISNKKNLI
jgi:hypothetical protein